MKTCPLPPGEKSWEDYVNRMAEEAEASGEPFDLEEFLNDAHDDYLLDEYGL